jgi:hypothetical protein
MSSKTMRYPAFELELPKGWEDQTVATFVGKTVDGFQTNIVVAQSMLGERLGVERHARKQLDLIATVLDRFTIEKEESREIAGHRAYYVEHHFATEEGVDVFQMQLYVGCGDTVVTFTASMAPGAVEKQRPVIEEVFAGITCPDA